MNPQPPLTLSLPDLCQQRIAQLLASGRRKILGIAAAPGAGKSTLAQAIQAQLGDAVQVVPMDGFHLANSELVRLGRRGRKGAPDTFDAPGYVSLLHRIQNQRADEVVYAPEYRREVEEAIAGAIAVLPHTQLIVTEGNYLLLEDAPWCQLADVLDETWYLDVPDDLREGRRWRGTCALAAARRRRVTGSHTPMRPTRCALPKAGDALIGIFRGFEP